MRISGSLIWSKTLMELMFNPCDEFRWSPEGPVSQIHSPHLLVGAPGTFSDLLRSVQMLKRDCGTGSNGELPHLFIPSESVTLVPEFAVEDLTLNRTWWLNLQWKTCPWAQNIDDDGDEFWEVAYPPELSEITIIIIIIIRVFCPKVDTSLQAQEPRL